MDFHTTENATGVMHQLFRTVDCRMSDLGITVCPSIGRAPDFLEHVCFIEVEAQRFDNVLAFGDVRRLILALGIGDAHEVIIRSASRGSVCYKDRGVEWGEGAISTQFGNQLFRVNACGPEPYRELTFYIVTLLGHCEPLLKV